MDDDANNGAGGGVVGIDCFSGEGKAGVGGGGAAGLFEPFPKAFRAACTAVN